MSSGRRASGTSATCPVRIMASSASSTAVARFRDRGAGCQRTGLPGVAGRGAGRAPGFVRPKKVFHVVLRGTGTLARTWFATSSPLTCRIHISRRRTRRWAGRGDRDRLDVLGRHVRAAGQRGVAAGSRITASVPRGEAPTVALVSCGLRGLIPAVHQSLVFGEGPESHRGAALELPLVFGVPVGMLSQAPGRVRAILPHEGPAGPAHPFG